jgi:hypothetical protein
MNCSGCGFVLDPTEEQVNAAVDQVLDSSLPTRTAAEVFVRCVAIRRQCLGGIAEPCSLECF